MARDRRVAGMEKGRATARLALSPPPSAPLKKEAAKFRVTLRRAVI